MTGATPATTDARVEVSGPDLRARLLDLGSVFGKTFRDSRRIAYVLGALFALIVVVISSQVAVEYATSAKRLALVAQMTQLPAIFQGMLGEPIGIDRLGGFVSWRVINFIPVLLGIWAIVTLSGSLAGELSRGSLEFLAVSPLARARIAVEKVAGYLVALAIAVAMMAVGAYVSVNAFGTLPEDAVGVDAVVAHALWIFVVTLAPGALSFAVAPILGRAGALGVGAIALFASFTVNAYAGTIPAFDSIKGLSYFAVTAGHRPMAGVYDWPAVVVVGIIVVALLAIGVGLFTRRDMLVSAGGRIHLPPLRFFILGPFTRSLGERLPAALVWGAALAVYGAVLASAADQFVAALGGIPEIADMIQRFFPDANILSTDGFLQLAFFQEAILIVGIAAAGLVSGWASDEGDRRLEVVLSAPVSRFGWTLRSATAVPVGVGIVCALLGAGVVLGAATQRSSGNLAQTMVGVGVLALYGMALAGIGLAAGGLIRPSLAGPVTLILGLTFFVVDLLGGLLNLPDPIVDLALNRHLGKPIIGDFDVPGMLVCALLAVGGVIVCAMGMRRRDIGR